MKSIAFQAVRDGNGYVRSAFMSEASAGKPTGRGLIVAGLLLTLTATFVCLMLLSV